jgi:type I restriction enzyme S subunit
MHNEWQEKRLEDICELVNGRGFKPHEWKTEGLPIIRIQNLNGSDEFNHYSGEFDPKILVEPGQLLFAWSGSRGASFGPHIWEGPTGVLNYHTWKVHPADETDRDFLFQLLQFETEKIEASSHGASALVHVQKGEMEQRKFDVPPLPEQRKIAQILRTWDAALEKLTALRAAHEDRFLGLRDTLMARASRRGEPVCFGDFLTESRIPGTDGATARKISVRLYGKGATEKNEPRRGSANTRYYRRAAGQIIWSKLDFLNGAFALVGPELDRCESTLDLPAFDCDSSVNPVWLIEYLTRPAYYTKQVHLARGQRKARRIAPDDWLASPLRLPDRATQDRIADVLGCARTELSLVDAEIEALTRQKRGLMQKLLTGEWRVATAEPTEVAQ